MSLVLGLYPQQKEGPMAQPEEISEQDRGWMERLRQKVFFEAAVTAMADLPQPPPEPMVPTFAELLHSPRAGSAATLPTRRQRRLGD